jgi:hypothetical protein
MPEQYVFIKSKTALSQLGDEAYGVARDRARVAWQAYRHWDAVRRELARRTKRSFLDTATRMLERPRGQ